MGFSAPSGCSIVHCCWRDPDSETQTRYVHALDLAPRGVIHWRGLRRPHCSTTKLDSLTHSRSHSVTSYYTLFDCIRISYQLYRRGNQASKTPLSPAHLSLVSIQPLPAKLWLHLHRTLSNCRNTIYLRLRSTGIRAGYFCSGLSDTAACAGITSSPCTGGP